MQEPCGKGAILYLDNRWWNGSKDWLANLIGVQRAYRPRASVWDRMYQSESRQSAMRPRSPSAGKIIHRYVKEVPGILWFLIPMCHALQPVSRRVIPLFLTWGNIFIFIPLSLVWRP